MEIPEDPHAETWEATPLTDEQLRNPVNVIPPAARPRVVLRYANAPELLVSGLLDGGAELAQHAAVIDSPYGEGHVVLFSNNPYLARGDQGQLFPGVQRDPELRPSGCGQKAGGEIGPISDK